MNIEGGSFVAGVVPGAPVMRTIHVVKFGGSSLATSADVRNCAIRVARMRDSGTEVVAVVSAMGNTTDRLCALRGALGIPPNSPQSDRLIASGERLSGRAMSAALSSLGHEPVTLDGGDAGLVTDDRHGRSRLLEVRPDRVFSELDRGRIPVVMGFQGITNEGAITTLGRGGSDTTAVALAAGIRNDDTRTHCTVFTDVDGVHTADPNIVEHAMPIRSISYQVMQRLSRFGARVMAHASVLHAEQHDVPVTLARAHGPSSGTRICSHEDCMPTDGPLACTIEDHLLMTSIELNTESPRSAASCLRFILESECELEDLTHRQHGSSIQLECIAKERECDSLASQMALLGSTGMDSGYVLRTKQGLSRLSIIGRNLKRHSSSIRACIDRLSAMRAPLSSTTIGDERCSFLLDSIHSRPALREIHRILELDK